MPSADGKEGLRTSIRNHQPGHFYCSAVIAVLDSRDGEKGLGYVFGFLISSIISPEVSVRSKNGNLEEERG